MSQILSLKKDDYAARFAPRWGKSRRQWGKVRNFRKRDCNAVFFIWIHISKDLIIKILKNILFEIERNTSYMHVKCSCSICHFLMIFYADGLLYFGSPAFFVFFCLFWSALYVLVLKLFLFNYIAIQIKTARFAPQVNFVVFITWFEN